MRACQTCGGSLAGRQGNARYCSDICRSRGNKSKQAPPALVVPDPGAGRLSAATSAEAQTLGVDGSLVVAALLLAEQADAADQRALPALMREWRAAMAELRAASTRAVANPLDELRRRRERTG